MARPTTKLENIEKTAMDLFSNRGLAQVTVKDIARGAGCAEGALYRHYKSKEEMAWKLFTRELEKFGKELEKVLNGPETFNERLKKGLETFYLLFEKERAIFRFILLTQHNFPNEGKLLDKKTNPFDIVTKFIQEGVSSGVWHSDDPVFTTSLVMGMVLQPATMKIYGRIDGTLSQKVNEITKACQSILINQGVKNESGI